MRIWMRVSVLGGLLACTAAAVDWNALKPQGYVSDFARVIDGSSRVQLESYLAAAEKSTGAEIALVTIPSLQGEPVEDVANTLFRAWGIGKKGKNEGVLLLLAVGERKSRMEVGYGLEPVLPDGFVGTVLREMRPALRQQQYGEALKAAAQTIGGTIAKSKNVSLDAPLPRRIPPDTGSDIPWVPLIFVGIFILVLLRARGRRGPGVGGGGGFWTGLILGNLLSAASGGSRGSGGFGGFDSGDSFGGFGGGDSGGGGASSNW